MDSQTSFVGDEKSNTRMGIAFLKQEVLDIRASSAHVPIHNETRPRTPSCRKIPGT
jgi:hypothetical protein